MSPKAALALFAAVVLWGGAFTATKAAVTVMPPTAFAVLRFAIATATMLLAHAATRTPIAIPRPWWGATVAAAFLGYTLTYLVENYALLHTTSGNGALLIGISPLATAVGAVLFLGERPSWRLVVGAVVASVGVAWLVGADLAHTGWGDALMALVMLMSVSFGLINKRMADHLPAMPVLTWTFGLGLLGLLPFALAEAWFAPGPPAWPQVPPTAWLSGAYLGLGASCLANWLWYEGIKRTDISRAGVFLYLMPLVTLFAGHQALGERLDVPTLTAAALILLGVAVATRSPTPKPLPSEAEAEDAPAPMPVA